MDLFQVNDDLINLEWLSSKGIVGGLYVEEPFWSITWRRSKATSAGFRTYLKKGCADGTRGLGKRGRVCCSHYVSSECDPDVLIWHLRLWLSRPCRRDPRRVGYTLRAPELFTPILLSDICIYDCFVPFYLCEENTEKLGLISHLDVSLASGFPFLLNCSLDLWKAAVFSSQMLTSPSWSAPSVWTFELGFFSVESDENKRRFDLLLQTASLASEKEVWRVQGMIGWKGMFCFQ